MRRTLVALFFALALLAAACGDDSSSASSGGGGLSIQITAPADGATVGRRFSVTLEPSVPIGEPSTGRNHVHLYYDGNRSTNLADYDIAYGPTFDVTRLSPGQHTIEAVVANADHSLTDAATSITVMVSASGAPASSSSSSSSDPYGY